VVCTLGKMLEIVGNAYVYSESSSENGTFREKGVTSEGGGGGWHTAAGRAELESGLE